MTLLTKIIPWTGAFLLVCLAALSFGKPQELSPDGVLKHLFDFSQNHRAELMVATALCVLVAQFGSIPAEKRSQQKAIIQAILDTARDEALAGVKDNLKHQHRLTLFRCQRLWRRLLIGRYLAVHVRSGPHSQTRRLFRVGDRDVDCEGIAGWIWYIDAAIPRTQLLAWPDDPNDAAGQQAYADAGRLSLEKARSLNVKARVFWGSIIRVNGEKWGVLLLDSRVTTDLGEVAERILQHCATLLNKVL